MVVSPSPDMLSDRLSSTIATGLWVAGALLVGQALHVSVVTGEAAVTSPAPVFYTVAGIVLILVAQNLDVHPAEYLDYLDSDEDETADEAETEFDPEASPLDEEALSNLEERDRDGEFGRE